MAKNPKGETGEFRELLDEEDKDLVSETVSQDGQINDTSGSPRKKKPLITGEKFRKMREELGWTQIDLATALGCQNSQVSRWEAGTNAMSKNYYWKFKNIYVEYMDVEGPDYDDILVPKDGREVTFRDYEKMLAKRDDVEGMQLTVAEKITGKAGTNSWRKPSKWIAQTAAEFMEEIWEKDGKEEQIQKMEDRQAVIEKAKKETKDEIKQIEATAKASTVKDFLITVDSVSDNLKEALGEKNAKQFVRKTMEKHLKAFAENIKTHYEGAKQNLINQSLNKMKDLDNLQKQLDLHEENVRLLKEVQEMHRKQAEVQQEESRWIKEQNEKLLAKVDGMMSILKEMADRAQIPDEELYEKMREEELEDMVGEMQLQEWKDGHREKGE